MMGFRPEPRVYRLTFADTDLAGLEAAVRSVTVRQYSDMMSGATDAEVLAMFAAALVSWNLEDPATGDPVPPTAEGVDAQDSNLITRVIRAWQQALTTVPPTSKTPSPNGVSPMEQSLAGASVSLPS